MTCPVSTAKLRTGNERRRSIIKQDFDFGLQVYLDGVAAFIDRVGQDK